MTRPSIRPGLLVAGFALLASPVALRAQAAAPASRDTAMLAARLDGDTVRSAAYLLAPAEAFRGKLGEEGKNRTELRYWLRVEPKSVTIEILDARGRVIRTLSSADTGRQAPPARKGHNTVAWDLRHESARALDGAPAHPGPLATPGTYQVRLTVNRDTATRSIRSLVVHPDPRSTATTTDRGEQLAFLVRARDRANVAREAVERIARIRAQVAERDQHVPQTQKVRWQLLSTVLRERLQRIEKELHGDGGAVIEQLARVSADVGRSDARPGPAAYTMLTSASMELDKREIELREEITGTLVRVNDVLRASKLDSIVP